MSLVSIAQSTAADQTSPPLLSRTAASLACSLAKIRDLPQAAGHAARIGPPQTEFADPLALGLDFACGRARLTGPNALVHSLLNALDPAASAAPEPWRLLLLELALDSPLSALAAAHPALALSQVSAADPGSLPYAIGFFYAGYPLRLDMAEPVACAVAAALAGLPARRQAFPGLTVRLHARVAAATIHLSEWRAASPGHVILTRAPAAEGVLLVAGEHLVWHARRDTGCLHVTSGRQRLGRPELEQMWMQDDSPASEDASSLDDLPIRLSFELAQFELTLAELETLQPGHVFQLGRAEADAVDILANGRRIGAGRVVLVAGSPGVQITRLGPK